VLDDFLASLFGDYALESLRGKWAARLVVGAAVLAVLAFVFLLLFVL
jgi:hypothetical protein